MTSRDEALTLLRQSLQDRFGDFRPGQWEAIDAVVNHSQRLLVVQRTGWGKSAVYFIATRILRDRDAGPTLIVSPLLALMRNQQEAADRLRIRAVTINSANSKEWPALVAEVLANRADALLVSPERLANDEFVQGVLSPIAGGIGLLVVDEAHCISDWGHDFRPDYRRLTNVLRRMPASVPIIGTTATANDRVVDDIRSQLGRLTVLRGSLMRESLALQTLRLPDRAARLAWLAATVPSLPGSGIIYTLTRHDADQVAAWLQQNGVNARAYYSNASSQGGDDSAEYRVRLEQMLQNNEVKALVATSALGMGFDKPDLGFVIHYQAPGSVIAYYQQVGRAGRAIDRAYGVLLAGKEDEEIHEYFRSHAFPSEEQVRSILTVLEASDGCSEASLERAVNMRRGQITQVLKFLAVENPAPVIKSDGQWRRTSLGYSLDHEQIGRLTRQREEEWQQVLAYVDSRECLMVALARALDDVATGPCGHCSVCQGRPVVGTRYSDAMTMGALRYLAQSEMPLACKMLVPPHALDSYGFRGRLPRELRAGEGRVLSRWGDAGWGAMFAEDKRAGRFRDDLVTALAEMIRERWHPDPWPTWVTCVPSLRRPTLVPDLAQRLAARLRLPFIAAVRKAKENGPQKLQQNSDHQCRNLDGVFEVSKEAMGAGPVLLLDDVVDSGWTMTIVAALLLQAGAGPVWPVALATSRSGD